MSKARLVSESHALAHRTGRRGSSQHGSETERHHWAAVPNLELGKGNNKVPEPALHPCTVASEQRKFTVEPNHFDVSAESECKHQWGPRSHFQQRRQNGLVRQ